MKVISWVLYVKWSLHKYTRAFTETRCETDGELDLIVKNDEYISSENIKIWKIKFVEKLDPIILTQYHRFVFCSRFFHFAIIYVIIFIINYVGVARN